MIRARSLRKAYGDLIAVDDVSFTVEKGESFGLLGPNGAGKSTVIHLLSGVLVPDGGEVEIAGLGDPRQPSVRRHIGVAPQELALYEEFTAEENLSFFASLYGPGRAELRHQVDWALDFAGLGDRRRQRVSEFSGGMKRRLNLAAAVVHRPAVLICDEPTVGVDPQSRNHVFECIESLRTEGTTLLYTTHYMEEAQRLCDRVAIQDRGKILALDTVDALLERHGGRSLVEAELATLPGPDVELPGTLEGHTLRVDTERPFEWVAALGRGGIDVQRLRIDRPDLERVFLELTGRRLRDS